MKKFNMTLIIGAMLTVLASCHKEDVASPDFILAPASAVKFQELRDQALQDLTQTTTFKAEEGVVFTSEKGAVVTINPGCLRDEEDNVITGDVTLSFVEIYDRGNMVAANKPVMGKDMDNDGKPAPLVTGGQYNLKVMQGDKILKSSCYFSVTLPADHTGGVDDEMILWKGQINEDGNLVWEEARKDNEANVNPNEHHTRYDIWEDTFGWTNVDRFYSDDRDKTQIKVVVPEGYDNENSGVFLAYEGEPNVLAQLDMYNTAEGYFSEHYGFIPIGLNVHVIFVSESKGEVVYAIKKVTIEAGKTIAINSDALDTTTKDDLVEKINMLN
ncbi:hypothetical protein [Parapedobacter sp. 10938]|uniref:hypothetical protein n=1 Tax=Parapedobacter flavus TaxID=3110225 RepID=UPI002DB85A22|nr:hypothetical protein [Parapedobacter sp. 10938]MEC3879597.1 hypothetical protein [Parapedobacter sp. 10938]